MIASIILALTVTFGAVRAQMGCDTKADVTFLIDSSSNVGRNNFQKQLNFIKDVSNNMQVAPDKVQVSAVTFGTGVTNQFYLNQYTDNMLLEQAIMNIPYKGGQVKMANAIRFATGTSFSPIHGGRSDAPHVAVLLTNQPSGTIDQIKLESQTARDNGLILYTVGIGGGVDQSELQTIASDPDIRHMFSAQNFDALGSLSDLLATKICNELPPDPTMLPAPTGCLQKADLVFMVDSSSSVGSTNFQKLEHFLKDVVKKIDVAPNKVQVGVVKYGSYPSIEFSLGEYKTRPEALKAIEGMTYLGGGTNDADAISYTGSQVFSQYSGARGDVPRIAVLITDGGSANPDAAVAAADKARQENIGMIAIGVGNRVNSAELNKIADSPSADNTFQVRSYDDLDSITDKLISQMCKVKSTQPSITGATLPPDPCKDVLANCDQYGNDVCTNYASWAQQNCAKFCGFCTPLFTNAPPKCEDTLPDCSNYGRDYCSQPGSYVAQNCQLFCGFCGVNTSSVGYYGKCSYKGKTYKTGEKWLDGCDYECMCEDGNTGKYKCNNRCPVYYNLPPDCTLVAQPGECCLQPVCNFNPKVNVQQSSGHAVTPDGIDVCVYKGKQYYQRQSWRDGCDYQCKCTDAKTGLYKCEDLCPTYSSIPPYCHLEQPAGECCKKPVCEFDSQTGSFQGAGSISGYGVGAKPTEHPPCLDAISTCNMYGKEVCMNYRGWAAINCRKYCDMCPDGLPKPGPNDRCVYGGQLYKQGESWNTTCDTMCTCENAIYGYYRCVNSCPKYNNVPNGCQVIKKAGECCPTMQCVNGFFLSTSLTPGSIGNGGAINVTNPQPGITYIAPTSSTGGPVRPGTGSTGFIAPSISGCLYKGQIYVQDQAWEDGCEYTCVCKEASSGLYSCSRKCPNYPALPPSCSLVTDPNDECCKAPKCGPDPVTHQVPVPIPVFLPATQIHSLVEPPRTDNFQPYTLSVTLYPTGFTPAPPTVPSVGIGTGGIGYCLYRNQRYKQDQVWEDGCDFNCVCEDASKGHYQCTEKCVHYGVLPKQCYLIKDPVNPCCDIPKCNFQVNYVTHIGELKFTTARPQGEYCVYEGQQYQQGQTWYDGCSFKCTCEDASENQYRCLTRCPEYEDVDETCDFLPDPKDPSCCVMPKCPTTATPGPTELPPPASTGSFIGQGTGTGYCEYKGVHYTQGQSWQDGCDLNCVCTDAESGLYRCTEICQRYNNLPEYCTLVTDFTNPCCKKPRCNFPAVTQAVTGANTPTTLAPTPPPPGQSPVPQTGSTLAPHYKYCVYKGVQYSQGETWEDGCMYRCRCDDADKGLYVCNERCASYDNVPKTCKMLTDPDDSCCLVPSCVPEPGTTAAPIPGVSTPAPTPYQIPTVAPGSVTGSANVPTPKPGMTAPPLNYCEYKGMQYTQGQKWDDGCDYTCECVDANIGQYKCVEKCNKYVGLPSNCRLSKDPANPCCQVPECTGEPTPAPPTTPGPQVRTTPKPTPENVCVYKGNYYTQGQQWYDGCDYVCNCENAMEGLYTCNERCPQYGPLPSECTLVQSSSDPLCCKEPKCVFQNTKNQTSGYLTPPTPPPGVIYGGAATPTPQPTMAPSPGYSPTPGPSTSAAPKVCVYKGNMYQQGQKWQDGCNYKCECLDAMSGQYKCTEICAKYDDLPAGCRMITDPYNPCCKKPYCPAVNVPTPAPPGVSTPAPTPEPKTGCMYNGVRFSVGQQWNDGCDLQCVCEDEMTGFYRCNDRCRNYDVPEECTLVTDPRDACCKVPYCPTPTTPKPWYPGMVPTPAPGITYAPDKEPTPAPGSTYAPGMFPTWVPGMVPTPAPGYTYAPNKLPTPAPGQTYAPGLYPTWVPGMVPTPAPGITFAPNKIPTPAPGYTYPPGQFPTWVPGMVPTPAPGVTYAPNKIPTPAPGSTYAPGLYPTWVPGMVPTPAPGYTYAPNKIPTPAPGYTYAPGKFPTYVPGMVPTPAPGVTYAPWKIPTPAPGRTYAPGQFPTWVPGMVPTPAPGVTYAPDKIPTPAPGITYAPGYFPTWVPGMVPTPAPGVTYAPWKLPTPAPGRTYAPGKFPTWVPGMVPTPAPGYTYPPYLVPTPAPGQTYAPGQFPVITPSAYPTPAPGSTFPTWHPGMVPTPKPGQTYAPNLIPTPSLGVTYAPDKFPTWVPGMVPTPAPGKTFAPWLVPGFTPAPGSTYAPFRYPTWVPGMVPTPAPGVTYAPNKIPTPAPGRTYAPGFFPTWVPGMAPTPMPGRTFAPDKIPTPAPGITYAPGQFPTWVPGMVPTPAPGVTYAPNMIPTPAPGSTYAPLKYPTWVPGMVPTPAPGVTYAPNKIPTPAPGYTYAPGQFPTWVPGMVPTPAPGRTFPPNKIPTPAPGRTYAPGMFPTYVPGMVPTPAPGQTFAPWKIPTPAPGRTYAPYNYPTWIPGMVPTPAPGVTYAPDKIPTPAPGYTYAPGYYPTWVPGMVPTPAPGYTYAPDKIPTPAPGITYAPGQFPTYVPGMVPTPAPGYTYAPEKIPTPGPGLTYAPGMYPTWVPGMVPTPAPGRTYAPDKIPTPAPGQTYPPGNFPTPAPTLFVPTALPGTFQGSGVNGNKSGCVHYGVVYNAGQTWQDGCKYDCECLDDHTGRYECKERCPLFLNIPTYCRLVVDPNDACCKVPVCEKPTPAPQPTPQPTPGPGPGPTPAPTPKQSGSGVPGVISGTNPPMITPGTGGFTAAAKTGCVMNGVQYVAGQTWYMGCDQKCVCEDGTTGFYRCFDRCAKYPTIPTGCTLVPDPKDPTCCEVPQCIPVPSPGMTIPTGGPQTVTGVPGIISGSGTPPLPTPGTGGFTSAPKNVCVYKGRMYTQGQKWQDGCDYNCVCVDGMTGKYECTERCAAFPLVPPECKLQRDPNDVCCFVPVCDYNQTSPTLPPLVSPGVSTQLPPLPPSYCVYKGVTYGQGQTWDDGCQKKCRCDDADMNIYTCFDRCNSYNNLGSGCVMVADPADPCCQVPKCTYVPTPGPQPGTTLTPPTVCPYPMPTSVPGVITGGPQPDPVTGLQPSNVGYCEYKGMQYNQGQSWDDGCSYVCSCIDASSGQYQCTEKCPRYVGIPAYCKMAQDPSNKCCTKPACNVCPHTPAPVTGGTAPLSTPAPKEVCVMDGKQYTTGQKWYVGCDKICICDDGKTGAISCNDRCPSYPQQPGCTMVPDSRDPVCCQTPSCPGNAGVYGQVNGSGTPAPPMIPSPVPGSTMVAPSQPPQYCVYKGNMYTQGQKWQDGCQYECVCDDAMTGHYHCTDRCPRYPNLASNCHLVYDPTNPCCKKPECTTAAPSLAPGQSPSPGPNPTPSTQFCVYQSVPLRQGQTFSQGCDKVCKCEDAMTGKITCDDRCPTYPALSSNCTLKTDPQDQCCQIPVCTTPTGVVGVPGVISGSNLPTNNPYNPGTSGSRDGCVYNGQVYTQGQTWDDGCKFTCECLDSSTGRYRCTEKCPRTPPLPSYCTLTQDPNNKCCQTPFCQPPTVPPTVPPGPTSAPNPMSTPAPPQNVCIYKGSTYQQGQQWYDGCEFICRCEDASKNFYNCKERCAKFTNIQPGCTLVPDQKDPTCCQRPSCPLLPPTGPNPTPGIVTASPQPPGVITGVNPTPQPGTTGTGTRTGCIYKGQVFHKGQKFDDGCDFECECLDDATGQYKCVEKCQKYSSIPSECVLIQDPKKPCCQVPFCDFTNPTPFPGGVPTPAPAQVPTPQPGVVTVAPYVVPGVTNTPRPGVNPSFTLQPTFTTAKPQGYCVYKGVYYTQGQTWDDGCDKRCRCEDVLKGYYTCTQRCASYPVSSCPLKTDPADSCCLIPDCNSGSIPTPIPTPGPGQTTINPVITPKPVSGSFTGSSGGNPVVVPFQPGSGSTGSTPACVYKGMIYTQGQQWNDGCSYTCECIDAQRGQYRCNDRCPKYPYLPPQCHYKQSTRDACCQEPECYTYIQPSTQAPITVKPGLVTGPSGSHPTINPSAVCVYTNGVQYPQGATWQDGCEKECKCTDATANIFECTEKCPVFSGLPSFCILVKDPSNTCCMKPQCTLPSGQTLSPLTGTATPPPTSLQVLPVGTHVVLSGYNKPQPGQILVGGKDQCVYKGTLHADGTSWEDGCKYVCTCENGKTGMYRCTSKCPQYPQLPSYCKSVTVPGQCCPTLTCDIPGYGTYSPVPQLVPTPRPTGSPSGSTSNPQIIVMPGNPVGGGHFPGGGYYLPNATSPDVTGSIRDKCVYKNRLYNQGETWDDGCDYRCQCMDSRTGYYVCNPLCPVYNNLPSNQCYLVKADGQCCSQPMCYDPNTNQVVNPLTGTSVFPVVGTFSGGFTGFRPYTTPGGEISGSGKSNACVYKGTVYHQNDKWDDGCDFTCTCLDETKGMYSCSAKCPVYTNIPPVCRLEAQTGSCCKRVVCNTNPGITRPPGPTQTPPTTAQPKVDPKCHDNINNCRDYGKDACGAIYKDWATRNCRLTCGICTPSFTTPPPVCADKLSDCKDYGMQACSGIYEPWARDNCAKYCGLCPSTAPSFSGQPVITTPSSTVCEDKLSTCNLLDKSFYCSGEYYSYALENCQKTCGLCNEHATTTPIPSTTTVSIAQWLLFLKGVAGAPGPDLYQLWHSPNTLNPDVPDAKTLTSSFNGHYKPDYSNHWKDLCIDQVKVGIYNQGVEKAYIIFNATGADKNSWFTPSRIISSSWTDLKTAQKQIFSMAGDANTGREFYISGQSSGTDGCDSFGWFMVSTKSSCFFEAGDKKPSFYYAPGTSQAHWGFTNPGTGDVFAIQAHSQCPPGVTGQVTSGTQTSQPAVCDYKGKQYTQGQFWTDGCQYNCTCEDASIGYYRCRNLCPQYTQLPPGCKLVTRPGACCAEPDCGTIAVSTLKPQIIVGGAAFCVYKGQYYTQDQTWNDGCSQSCKCTDANQGMYSCRALCLNWNTLPSVCHLEPAPPGLCCQQPKCPGGILINIPRAYKDEYPGYSYV